jgi:hypothetical protein
MVRQVLWRQYSAAIVGTTLVWAGTITIVQAGCLQLPTRRQWLALFFRYVLSVAWQTIGWMTVALRLEQCSS